MIFYRINSDELVNHRLTERNVQRWLALSYYRQERAMELLHQTENIITQRYRIISILGQGSSGITYKAEDLNSHQLVALKTLSLRAMTDWKMMELFEREARVLSQLNHPRIPRYLDYFQVDSECDRTFYIAQQLAEGESLATLVQSGWHASEKEVRRIANQILEILVYLHSQTPPVIHRDIKPQNIICTKDKQVFLVDFGSVQNAYYNTFMRGSTVVGTFGYMAPEQFIGQAVPATDLYGLGATLLFLLTHRFPADLPADRLKIDFRDRIQVSEEFANWLEKMLEPDLEERFQSAKAALEVRRSNPMFTVKSNPSKWCEVFVKLGIAAVVAATVFNHFKYPILSTIGFTPEVVLEAVRKGDVETVSYYLDLGIKANAKVWVEKEPNRNLLHMAGSKEMAKLLIAKGADVNARDSCGFTPLYLAVARDRLEVAETLIAEGADIDAKTKNKYGFTPLHIAVARDRLEVAEMLIAEGADIDAKNKYGNIPLHIAYSKEVASLLIAKGANVNAKNINGDTPLHTALGKNWIEGSKLLIAKGANIKAKNRFGKTPLDVATENSDRYGYEYREVEELLLNHGAQSSADLATPN